MPNSDATKSVVMTVATTANSEEAILGSHRGVIKRWQLEQRAWKRISRVIGNVRSEQFGHSLYNAISI